MTPRSGRAREDVSYGLPKADMKRNRGEFMLCADAGNKLTKSEGLWRPEDLPVTLSPAATNINLVPTFDLAFSRGLGVSDKGTFTCLQVRNDYSYKSGSRTYTVQLQNSLD